MSGAIIGATAGATAASSAAAAAAARMREEEEELTVYNKDDMDGWEFKIIRSYQTYFKKPENLKKVCQEEAKAGWEMVEKFDDYRVRFKRPQSARVKDGMLPGNYDPYRTQFDAFGRRGALIVGVLIGFLLLLLGFVLVFINLAG